MQFFRDYIGPLPFSCLLFLVPLMFHVATSGPVKPKSEECSCVAYYKCAGSLSSGYINSKESKSKCKQPSDVYCCRDSLIPDGVDETTKPSKNVRRSVHKSCGHWNPNGLGSGFDSELSDPNSETTKVGEYPWQVALLNKTGSGSLAVKCGASVIHPQVILTTVNCVNKWEKNFDQLVIRVGEWDGQNDNEQYPHQDGKVSKILKHEGFSIRGNAIQNDVALIVLEKPFKLGDNVDTLCLPPQDFKFEKEKCHIVGWEKNAFDKAIYVEKSDGIMKQANMTIMANGPCLNLLKRTELGENFKLHDTFICVKGTIGKKMTFRHHNGCPLMCPTKENPLQFYQAGMIVKTPEGYKNNTPFMYVKVAKFRDWIDQKMTELNFDTSYYMPYASQTSLSSSSSPSNRITFVQ